MKTLVISIHVKHQRAPLWRELQERFVRNQTKSLIYKIIANGVDPDGYSEVAVHNKETRPHYHALCQALLVCKESFADRFLFLDSDCWPVRSDWQDIIEELLSDVYLYAAPIRCENFDIFPHPCAFYCKSEFLKLINFNYLRSRNLLGKAVSDVGMSMPQIVDNKQVWFPLVKTNQVSPHPVFASIYGDLFYHHCAGSRGSAFRADDYGVYDHIFNKSKHRKIYQELTKELIKHPRQFINYLRGVS